MLEGMREQKAAKLNVAIGGKEDAPTIVMVHGLGGTWRVFQPLIDALISNYRIVSVDLPGFGKSPKIGHRNFDLDHVCRVLHKSLKQLNIKQFTLMGYSMGGGVSFNYARHYPEDVARLILIAPGGLFTWAGPYNRNWHSSFLHKLSRIFQRYVASVLVSVSRRWIHSGFGRLSHNSKTVSKRQARMMVLGSARGRNSGPAGIAVSNADLHRFVDDVTLPTLFLWGEEDRVVSPRGRVERLKDMLPNARFVMLPETGHLPMYERTGEMVGAINGFVHEVSRDLAAHTKSHSD